MARFIRWADDYTLWAFNPPDALAPGGSPTRRSGADQCDDQPEDPAATLRDLEHERSRFDRHLEDLHEESARAVRMLRRRGWSFGRIAAETGISNQRVAQLARSSLGAGR
jgi:DNA-directed RNA polymerase specialized sigma24 family protein